MAPAFEDSEGLDGTAGVSLSRLLSFHSFFLFCEHVVAITCRRCTFGHHTSYIIHHSPYIIIHVLYVGHISTGSQRNLLGFTHPTARWLLGDMSDQSTQVFTEKVRRGVSIT